MFAEHLQMIAPVKSSHLVVFYKKDVFKSFPKFRRKKPVLILIVIKLQASALPKNVRNFFVFSHFQEVYCRGQQLFEQFSRIPFFIEQLRSLLLFCVISGEHFASNILPDIEEIYREQITLALYGTYCKIRF